MSFLSFMKSCILFQAFQILQNLFHYLGIRKLIQKSLSPTQLTQNWAYFMRKDVKNKNEEGSNRW